MSISTAKRHGWAPSVWEHRTATPGRVRGVEGCYPKAFIAKVTAMSTISRVCEV
jgi:hypothetical protein